jgi:membrane protein YqaA with SNARE-associated domain
VSGALLLFGYGFLSNVALSILPHEPAVIWYGTRLGVWPTVFIATGGTMLAALADHRLFVPLLERLNARRRAPAPAAFTERVFRRWPFLILALSGLTPLPFFPFKVLALTTSYPLGRYVSAVAARCLPRYALLAWLGTAVRLPTGLFVALFALLLIPSLRWIPWPTRAAT